MDKKLMLLAARAVKKVYDGKGMNIGSTEWYSTIVNYNDRRLQVLAIGGSDEIIDWIWNVILASWGGVKLCSYVSAHRILKIFRRAPGMPLLVTGHSKAGPTAPYLAQLLGADWCVSICPAPGFRKAVKMDNTVLIIDPDDPVPHLGKLNFKHPDCERYILPDDHEGLHVMDHSIEHVIGFLESEMG